MVCMYMYTCVRKCLKHFPYRFVLPYVLKLCVEGLITMVMIDLISLVDRTFHLL